MVVQVTGSLRSGMEERTVDATGVGDEGKSSTLVGSGDDDGSGARCFVKWSEEGQWSAT